MKRLAVVTLLLLLVVVNTAFEETTKKATRRANFSAGPDGVVYLVVDKSDYELRVYDDEGWYATYPVVFGNKDLGDKMMEGDRKTPEGNFKIISKRPHQKWHKMLMLDYPTPDSWSRFNERKANGKIPKAAKIGGGIAIHGTWPNDNLSVDDFSNWTNGCVSLKNEDLDELEVFLPVGTKVTIQR
ncbi:MAG: L,D-transpeptidase family protein [Pseudobacter sp.]|uniref:L,D-transpeptidase family protein n=1 Tax=Pseudobacter sp. TaxID=2045420 RepID=UPI003F8141EF